MAWGGLWNRFTPHLSQKTPQNHANKEVQIFVFTLRMPMKQHGGYIHLRGHQVSERCHFTGAVSAIPPSQGGPGESAQARQWGWTQVTRPSGNTDCSLSTLKNAENNAECKSFDADSLVILYMQLNKTPEVSPRLTELRVGLTPTWAHRDTLRWSSLKMANCS